MCCSVLQCVSHCVAVYCGVLQYIVVCCLQRTLQHNATQCNTPQHTARHTATHCNALQHAATHCIGHVDVVSALQRTLQHTATHYNTLQHAATHCNALQHAATHCIGHVDVVTALLQRGADIEAKTCWSGYIHMLQCVAVCCSVLQCVIVSGTAGEGC